jgi:hypothetical protein
MPQHHATVNITIHLEVSERQPGMMKISESARLGLNPGPSLISCVTFVKLLNLPVSTFPPL